MTSPSDDLIDAISARRNDPIFMKRLQERIAEDGPLLDRIAKGPCDDPIECGHQAALGQWEARWQMVRSNLSPNEHADAEMLVMMDRIERKVPTGQPVMSPETQVWVVRMFPERWKRLIKLLRTAGAHPSGLGSYDRADANNFADIIEVQVGL